ncbi:hypothetical protein BC829DRAFT_486352 [Chytridium lagenaria]|nr:hypothetical protein BC829DRAFT_486352 [Chytridium lagenaria]
MRSIHHLAALLVLVLSVSLATVASKIVFGLATMFAIYPWRSSKPAANMFAAIANSASAATAGKPSAPSSMETCSKANGAGSSTDIETSPLNQAGRTNGANRAVNKRPGTLATPRINGLRKSMEKVRKQIDGKNRQIEEQKIRAETYPSIRLNALMRIKLLRLHIQGLTKELEVLKKSFAQAVMAGWAAGTKSVTRKNVPEALRISKRPLLTSRSNEWSETNWRESVPSTKRPTGGSNSRQIKALEIIALNADPSIKSYAEFKLRKRRTRLEKLTAKLDELKKSLIGAITGGGWTMATNSVAKEDSAGSSTDIETSPLNRANRPPNVRPNQHPTTRPSKNIFKLRKRILKLKVELDKAKIQVNAFTILFARTGRDSDKIKLETASSRLQELEDEMRFLQRRLITYAKGGGRLAMKSVTRKNSAGSSTDIETSPAGKLPKKTSESKKGDDDDDDEKKEAKKGEKKGAKKEEKKEKEDEDDEKKPAAATKKVAKKAEDDD